MSGDLLRREDHDGIAVVTVAHGAVNALDLELLGALTDTFRALDTAGTPFVLTGEGRAFSAGVDLRRILDGGEAYVERFIPALNACFTALFAASVPTVAAVNGHALAGGCILTAACDRRLMSAGTIGITELRVGVPFPTEPLEIVRWAVGDAVCADLALTARSVEPEEAVRLGLVHRTVEPERLLEEALDEARRLTTIPPATFAHTKRQLRRGALAAIAEHGPTENAAATLGWASEDVTTAIGDFVASLRRS